MLLVAFGALVGVQLTYANFGKGVEFFPAIEPEVALVHVHARGNLSVEEMRDLVIPVEREVLAIGGYKSVYTTISGGSGGGGGPGGNKAEDVIGTVRSSSPTGRTVPLRAIFSTRSGTGPETSRASWSRPSRRRRDRRPGKPVQLELRSRDKDALDRAADIVRAKFEDMPGLVDIEDNRDLPGIEWQIDVDRAQASKFSADVTLLGQYVH